MKVAIKTLKKVVFEISKSELEKTGFDEVWDSIRKEYPENDYDIFTIEKMVSDEEVMFFELTPKSSV
mgnify:CR=1 FL=1